jgi:hypothetical protein
MQGKKLPAAISVHHHEWETRDLQRSISEGKGPLGRPGQRWECEMKRDLRKQVVVMEWIYLAYVKYSGGRAVNTSIKYNVG